MTTGNAKSPAKTPEQAAIEEAMKARAARLKEKGSTLAASNASNVAATKQETPAPAAAQKAPSAKPSDASKPKFMTLNTLPKVPGPFEGAMGGLLGDTKKFMRNGEHQVQQQVKTIRLITMLGTMSAFALLGAVLGYVLSNHLHLLGLKSFALILGSTIITAAVGLLVYWLCDRLASAPAQQNHAQSSATSH